MPLIITPYFVIYRKETRSVGRPTCIHFAQLRGRPRRMKRTRRESLQDAALARRLVLCPIAFPPLHKRRFASRNVTTTSHSSCSVAGPSSMSVLATALPQVRRASRCHQSPHYPPRSWPPRQRIRGLACHSPPHQYLPGRNEKCRTAGVLSLHLIKAVLRAEMGHEPDDFLRIPVPLSRFRTPDVRSINERVECPGFGLCPRIVILGGPDSCAGPRPRRLGMPSHELPNCPQEAFEGAMP